ncbi:hypothetical protein I5V61_06350 [Stenotrophomonas maltophilia]|uniref:hypothetical protein n=1 Tax=Stenotrophomonas geniculata TaxID=86188 RepID=UPI0018D40FCF|nr:hypothetical protein [Stenotrophomonas maltophilia]
MSAQDKYSLQERGRFKAWWDAARPLEGSAFPYEIAWAAWQAALSAQPSPGGQDARVQFDAWLEANSIDTTRWGDGEYTDPAAHNYWRAWQAALAARQPVGETVAIPEGWALVDLAEYTVLPQIPTTAMMDAGWPIGEQITDQFDVKGAYADLIAEHEAKGEGIIHGPIQVPAQAVDLDELHRAVCVVNVVGQIDGHDVVRRNSVLDVINTRRQRLADSQAVGNG